MTMGARTDEEAGSGMGRVPFWILLTVMPLAASAATWWAGLTGEAPLPGRAELAALVAAPGPDAMGWMGWPLLAFVAVVGIEALVGLVKVLFWRSPHWRWEVPDGELSPEDLADRREFEAEVRGELAEERHPLLRMGTWASIVGFAAMAVVPSLVDSARMAHAPRPAYGDRRQDLLDVARTCPPLAGEARAMIARGVPTAQQVWSMRARRRIVAASPVRGQTCSDPTMDGTTAGGGR